MNRNSSEKQNIKRADGAVSSRGSKSRRRAAGLSTALVLALSLVIAGAFAVISSAGSSLLSPGTSRILAGDSFDFTLNLSSVEADSDSDAEGTISEYVVTLSVSPSVSALKVKEGVGSINAVSGVYQVNSKALDGTTKLHFTVTPSSDITSETTYTVSVSVKGDHVNESDSFTFVVVPIPVQESSDTDSSGGAASGAGTAGAGAGSDAGKGMPGGLSKGGASKAGSGASSSSSSASVTYAGSWDNYLDELSVEGYEFTQKFNKTRDTYIMKVPLSVTSLTVHATASDSSALVAVTGNTDLPEGRSKIMVSVTADDDSVRIYRIYVDRTDESDAGKADETDAGSADDMNVEKTDGADAGGADDMNFDRTDDADTDKADETEGGNEREI